MKEIRKDEGKRIKDKFQGRPKVDLQDLGGLDLALVFLTMLTNIPCSQ